MSVTQHRAALLAAMPENSLAVLYAGAPAPANEDEYCSFAVNSHFFYLTDYTRAGMILLLGKYADKTVERLFIEEPDETVERWTGRVPRAEEVREKSGIEDVAFLSSFPAALCGIIGSYGIDTVFFDCYRNGPDDMPSFNALKAAEFKTLYPAVTVRDLRALMLPLREVKDQEELARMRRACEITAAGLDAVWHTMKPGMTEYQAQAIFEGRCMYEGGQGLAFPTISAGGLNACSMHYGTNRETPADGELLLMDLGARYENYCADVTRTFPVNGKFTPRQREIYDLVLKANLAVAEKAAPGVTVAELQELTCKVLGEGLVELGLLEDAADVRKYYMHSITHSLGIDAHDASRRTEPMKPGWVITDEPGLYIDEEGIGIRIEDDLLITETGCEVLTAYIPRTAEDIERVMAEGR